MSIDSQIRSIVREVLQEEVGRKKYEIELKSARLHDKNGTHITSLPFVPFVGLQLDCSGATVTIESIYWDYKKRVFQVSTD